jgi:hypothetical protein
VLAAFDLVVQVALLAFLVVGVVAVVRWIDGLGRPAPGWICWNVLVARKMIQFTCQPAEKPLMDGVVEYSLLVEAE